MIEFPIDTLREIASAAEAEAAYWSALFGKDDDQWRIVPGGVAVVINAALELGLVVLPSERAAPNGSSPTRPDAELDKVRPLEAPPTPDVARERLAGALANANGGSHDLVAAITRPRTLAEVDGLDVEEEGDEEHETVDDKTEHRRLRDRQSYERRKEQIRERAKARRAMERDKEKRLSKKGTHLPTLNELIAEVRRQAMAGVMPTMDAFNLARPATWVKSQTILKAWGASWRDLCEEAGLKPNRKA